MTPKKKLTLFVATAFAFTGSLAIWSHTTEAGSAGPDVTVYELPSTQNYGAVGGIRAYSVGTTSCNVGDQPLWWCDQDRSYCDDHQHPVIAQNLYRLKDGRFEQLGMSWLKHGFFALNNPASQCGDGTCVQPPHGSGDQLGVGCTDPYNSGLNGNRPLGLRSEVNATTGFFPFPETVVASPQLIDQRLQVAETDLDPALNPGARYWVEGHYVAEDDALRGNGLNNASHREAIVSAGSLNLNLTGPTVRQKPAIFAWQASQAGVEILNVDVDSAPVERYHVARRVTPAPEGGWHYEYAVHNLNSDRSGRALTVRFPAPAAITNVGFRDVDHHSGEPYDTMDWDFVTDADSVTWFTELFADDEFANALRWGTMFSFWFDADRPPLELAHSLELFKDGMPTTVDFGFQGALFFDGFESGDTSAWTITEP